MGGLALLVVCRDDARVRLLEPCHKLRAELGAELLLLVEVWLQYVRASRSGKRRGKGHRGQEDTDLLGLIRELVPLRGDLLGAGHELVAVVDLGGCHVLLAYEQGVGRGCLVGRFVLLGQFETCQNQEIESIYASRARVRRRMTDSSEES